MKQYTLPIILIIIGAVAYFYGKKQESKILITGQSQKSDEVSMMSVGVLFIIVGVIIAIYRTVKQ